MTVTQALRVAAILTWIGGVGLGVTCVISIRSLSAGRGIPLVLGFPAFGQGPFERHGINTTIPLVAGFLLISLIECVAGWLLWREHRFGAVLALATLPFGAIYWWGFCVAVSADYGAGTHRAHRLGLAPSVEPRRGDCDCPDRILWFVDSDVDARQGRSAVRDVEPAGLTGLWRRRQPRRRRHLRARLRNGEP